MAYKGYNNRQIPASTEIARWKLDEASGLVAANSGTTSSTDLAIPALLSAATPTRLKKKLIFEGGIEFGGLATHVVTGAATIGLLEPTGNHSITFWCSPSALATAQGDYIVQKRHDGTNWTAPNTAGLSFYVVNSSSTNQLNAYVVTNSATPAASSRLPLINGTLYFIAGTVQFTGGNCILNLYINGALVGTSTVTAASASYGNHGPWIIGGNTNTAGVGFAQCFNGVVEDVSIWNSTLTEVSIRNMYLVGTGLK